MFPRAFSRIARAIALTCTVSACSDEKDTTGQAPLVPTEAGAVSDAAADGSAPDAGSAAPMCTRPAKCQQIQTRAFIFDVCCTAQIECGLDTSPLIDLEHWDEPEVRAARELLFPADFDPKQPCVRFEAMIKEYIGFPEERVHGERGGDILVTPTCHSRSFFGRPLIGCCLPSGACGLATHLTAPDFEALTKPGGAPKVAECTTAADLNRQLQDTDISLMAVIPDSHGSCDYADLNKRLPPAPPP